MADDFKYDVFLSHSSKDKDVARDIAERLRGDGVRVWFEDWEIRPRTTKANREKKIEEGLERSRMLVLCMSANAFGPEWAQLEARTFRFRDPLNKERRFMPLRLDIAPVKGSLAQFLYINWLVEDREQEYSRLLEACRSAASQRTEAENAREAFAEKVTQLGFEGENIWDCAFGANARYVLTSDTDSAVRLWDMETGQCLHEFNGHTKWVHRVLWNPNNNRALSCSSDKTLRLWDINGRRCIRVLKGHTADVRDLAWNGDQSQAISSALDETVRLWDLETGRCLYVFEGHKDSVASVAWSTDHHRVFSGDWNGAIHLWDVKTGHCLRSFSGHTGAIWSLAPTLDNRRLLSSSGDHTIRLWDVETGKPLRVLEGHTGDVNRVVWGADSRHALSASEDETVRLWDTETGHCLCLLKGHLSRIYSVAWSTDQRYAFSCDDSGVICIWNLSEFFTEAQTTEVSTSTLPLALDQVQYTNAKVLLVGEGGAGKTGLTERLSHDTFTPSYSTSGTWSTQWQMKDLPVEPGWEREVWLWDFGGQADQRLIHQLYIDKAALILLVFNADRDVVVPGLREWQQALSRCVPDKTRTYLVAGRIDVGFRFDREKVRAFAREHGYEYFETSANDGRGCPELRRAIQAGIPWTYLERRTSPATWKLLKDEILKLRDEGQVLFTFKELRETLRQRLAAEMRFTDGDLETVVSLLDGPGVVKELSFGTYVLLRPEWINAYAQAVIRTLRADEKNLGSLPVQSIAAGKLIFQTQQAGGEIVEEKRLERREERIVLQAMEQMLLEHTLCLRQEGHLVFPSYCGIEKPVGPVPLKYFISYVFGGFLDDIYATLVVKLVYCGAFKLKELWRDAADFETLADQRTMGIKLLRNEDGRGTLLVHYGKGVPVQEQVIFANYIHEHLIEKAVEPERQRYFVCPHCDTPVANREVAMRKLAEFGKEAKIICVDCEKHMPLWDVLEERFASEEVKAQVALLQKQERIELDSRRKGKLLALEVAARITSADQKCFEIPGVEDEGIDMEVEFTHSDGQGSGKRMYLQLKAGNSYLERRKGDGAEIFRIKEQRWVEYWLKQDCPVLLVVGTFPKEEELRGGKEERFGDIGWMEIGELLRRESNGGKKPVKQIVFEGERLDVMSVRRWREKVLGRG